MTTVQRRAVNASDQKARDVILTVVPRLTLPANQLFQIHPEPGAKYLVETDPAFTNRQTFLSSDYFQQQLQLDPERSLKRYGNGFEEQRQGACCSKHSEQKLTDLRILARFDGPPARATFRSFDPCATNPSAAPASLSPNSASAR